MDDNCEELVECMGLASGCGYWEWVESMGVVSRRWVWVESTGEVARRYIDFLILLIPILLLYLLFFAASLLFVLFL